MNQYVVRYVAFVKLAASAGLIAIDWFNEFALDMKLVLRVVPFWLSDNSPFRILVIVNVFDLVASKFSKKILHEDADTVIVYSFGA